MKITRIIASHQKFSKLSTLENNLGDGYLFQHNRIFKNIRQLAISFGFNFSANTNFDYQALPLIQLESILAQKKIPYIDNVSAITMLARQLPNIDWNDLASGLKKNYILHESCHAVARSVFTQHGFKKDNQLGISAFQMLLEESFANTCELLAIVDVQDVDHGVFFEHNSYTYLPEIRTNIKKIISSIGDFKFFKFMQVTYLYSNFLRPQISENQLTKILHFLQISTSDVQIIKGLRSLSKIAFTLDLDFRTVTTQLHLKLNNQNIDLENFDFMSNLFDNHLWQKALDDLISKTIPADSN